VTGRFCWLARIVGGYWGFRGRENAEWFLHPTLDRAVEVSGEGAGFSFVTHLDRGVTEDRLLFRFNQQAHRHLRHLPDKDDIVTWLALMQHHGAPTRLIDWTKSPYLAAYFPFSFEPPLRCGGFRLREERVVFLLKKWKESRNCAIVYITF
jgi:FRG domain